MLLMRLLFGIFQTGSPNLVFFVREKKRGRNGRMLKMYCVKVVIKETDQINFIHLHSVNSVPVITPFTSI